MSIGVLGALFFFWWKMSLPKSKQVTPPSLTIAKNNSVPDEQPPQMNRSKTPPNLLNVIKAADFTDKEKAELAEKFQKELKPAVEKWAKAYEGRIPFRPEDLSFDKFHNQLGKNSSFYLYTFVFDGITLTVEESNGNAKVNYLMVRTAAIEMNNTPKAGFVPNLTIPVGRDDVIRMVKADSGVEFKPNEILIKPTAISCAFNGGAFVDVLPTGKDPNNALNFKISMVFGPDGNLVNYQRDPFF